MTRAVITLRTAPLAYAVSAPQTHRPAPGRARFAGPRAEHRQTVLALQCNDNRRILRGSGFVTELAIPPSNIRGRYRHANGHCQGTYADKCSFNPPTF